MSRLISIGDAVRRTGLGRDRLAAMLDRSLTWASPLGIRLGPRRDRFFYEEALDAHFRGERRPAGDLAAMANEAMKRSIRAVQRAHESSVARNNS